MNCNANEMHEMQKDIQIAKLYFYGKKPSDRLSNTQVNNVTIKKIGVKRLQRRCFPLNIAKFLKSSFL